jgi:hypothetical protein
MTSWHKPYFRSAHFSIREIHDNADRITESAKSELKCLCSNKNELYQKLRM